MRFLSELLAPAKRLGRRYRLHQADAAADSPQAVRLISAPGRRMPRWAEPREFSGQGIAGAL